MPLLLEIVTPERQVFSEEVDSVVCPGIEGEADDLPEQAFFLAGTLDDVRENAKKLAAA